LSATPPSSLRPAHHLSVPPALRVLCDLCALCVKSDLGFYCPPTPLLHYSSKLFICHTSEKSPSKSNHYHTSEIAACNPCVCHTSEAPRGSIHLHLPRKKLQSIFPSLAVTAYPLFPIPHPLSFQTLTDSIPQRRLLNSFGINPLRTHFLATGVYPSSAALLCAPLRTLRLRVILFPSSAILVAAGCRRHRSTFHTGTQGAPCSRCD